MKQKDTPSLYGIGPLYVGVTFIITVFCIVLEWKGIFVSGKIMSGTKPLIFMGSFLIVTGCLLWLLAMFSSKIQSKILQGVLVRDGVYRYVRNPIYSAFLFGFSGILCLMNNFWLLILPILFWMFLTVLLKGTEERVLLAKFGKEYEDYCRCTNRCLPWFPKKK